MLCMEWLGHSIHSTINLKKWKPLRLSRSRPGLSHLFFVDDLIVFGQVEMQQVKII